ncbi:MAG: hypothetical protein ACRENP_25370 [Longimicrobiales bacterium]
MTRYGLATLTLLLATTLPAAAQTDVRRRAFTFLDQNLTIQVVSEQAGSLRILRGEAGMVEVVAKTPDGFAGFALGGQQEDQLRLTSVGATAAEFLVVVPEDVRVRVRLPDRQHVEVASVRPLTTYRWTKTDAPDDNGGAAGPTAAPAYNAVSTDDMFLSHYSRAVPRSFTVQDLNNFDRLDVRFVGGDFRLATSRAVSVAAGRSDTIELRAVQPGFSALISLPTDTRDFKLVLGSKVALEVVGGEVRSYCDSVGAQTTGIGSRTYSYVPGADLSCR